MIAMSIDHFRNGEAHEGRYLLGLAEILMGGFLQPLSLERDYALVA